MWTRRSPPGGGGTARGGVCGQGGSAREDGARPAPVADHVGEDLRRHKRSYAHDEGGISRAMASQVREWQVAATVVGCSDNNASGAGDG